MRLREMQEVFVLNICILIRRIFEERYTCTLGEAWRPQWVAKHYAKIGKGIVKSLHCSRLALDINLFKNGKYLSSTEAHRQFGEIWEGLHPNNRWGGRYKDGNHYEMLLRKRRD